MGCTYLPPAGPAARQGTCGLVARCGASWYAHAQLFMSLLRHITLLPKISSLWGRRSAPHPHPPPKCALPQHQDHQGCTCTHKPGKQTQTLTEQHTQMGAQCSPTQQASYKQEHP